MIAETIGAKKIKFGLPNFIVKTYGTMTSFFAKLFKFTPAVTKELATISCDTHYYSPEKARKELGLPSTPVKEAVAECYAWFQGKWILR